MPESHISEVMRSAIGREMRRQVSYPVAESDIRKWALAVYYPHPPPREFIDPEYARSTQWGGMIAPQEFNPFNWLAAETYGPDVQVAINDPDMTEILLGVEGPHLKFQLNGGSEVEYGEPMRPGDVITSVSRLGGYHEREGRLGLMLFTVSEDVWTNQAAQRVKRTRSTLIRY
jgi:hypothetical protein